MADVPRRVLDASVAAKWHLNDEELAPQAVTVKVDFLAGRLNLIAPDHIVHEVASAIIKATRNPKRTERPTPQAGRISADAFLSWGITLVPFAQLLPFAYRLAEQFNCSYYDGIYLALAQEVQLPLIHADTKLSGALMGQFPLELWIEGYLAYRGR